MFLDIDLKDPHKIAVIDDSGDCLTYCNIIEIANDFAKALPYRTLIFLLAENCNGSLVGYTSALINHVVPLIISNKMDSALLNYLYEKYQPEFLWLPNERITDFNLGQIVYTTHGFSLVRTGYKTPEMYEELSLLLPTSGSTGSPKLIRHSYRNIEANAENVKNLFQLTPDERALAALPMHYTMGLSVITSHLYAGATLLLCGKSLLDSGFWKMMKDGATSFTGVPYSFELLSKLRFFKMELPSLKTITQGGGKLTEEMWKNLANYAEERGKRFIATYGQSECTARMAYLPAELASVKICSIGIAEPGGQLSIIDNDGNETFDGEATGEMVYRGENVTLGYANSQEDLLKGDDNLGIMYTGDIAYRDSDGCYFIIGRKKRFLKIFGNRIGLDECEQIVKAIVTCETACTGNDERLIVYLTNGDESEKAKIALIEAIHLPANIIETRVVSSLPKNESGKVLYSKLANI